MKTKTTYTIQRLPLLPVLAAYSAGILLQVSVFQMYFRWTHLLMAAAALLLFLVLSFKVEKFTDRFPVLRFTLLSGIIFYLGIINTASHEVRSDPQWLGHQEHQCTEFVIKLVDKPQPKARTVLLPASVSYGLREGEWLPLKGRVQVYVYKQDSMPQFRTGDQLVIPARLVPLTHNNNPGAFNFAEKQQRSGIWFQAFLSTDEVSFLAAAERPSRLSALRERLLDQLDVYIEEPVTQSLTQATLLNEAAGMDAQMQQDYANTGISHIIAISGMHVNMLFALFMLPLLWLKDKRKLWLKYILVLPFVWLYIALCNYPPSAVRAAVGFTLVTLTILLKRPQDNIHLLCINALVLLILEPMWLFQLGVQLSFLAVLSILVFYPPIRKWYAGKYAVLNVLWNTIAVSLSVQVLVFPLVLYYFHQFPVWFLVANCFAALFSLLQMSMALLIMLTGITRLKSLAALLGKGLVYLTTGFNQVIAWLNAHSPDLSRMIPLDALDFWLLLLMIVLLAAFWLRKSLWTLYAGLLTAFAFILNLILQDVAAARQEGLIVYAGTGQSAIEKIKGKSSVLLIDSMTAQSFQYAFKPARLKYRIADTKTEAPHNAYWSMQGKRVLFLQHTDSLPHAEVDYLILTRTAQAGAGTILEALRPGLVILDGSFGRSASLRYAADLQEQGFKVHNTQSDGAWWYFEK